MTTLGDYVQARREELRLSQADLGKLCGLSGPYISQLEAGTNPQTGKPFSIKIDTLRKLSKGLKVPYEALEKMARGMSPETAIGDHALSPELEAVFADVSNWPAQDQERFLAVVKAIRPATL